MTPAPLTAVAAIEKAMEGVTPGTWRTFNGTDIFPDDDDTEGTRHIADFAMSGYLGGDEQRANAAYVVAVQPDRMREVLALARKAEALERENDRLREVLRPFARIAEMENRAAPATSVMVNVNRCRDAKTAKGGEHGR